MQDPKFFRYRYCNYDLVTPPLTSLDYPLVKNAAEEIDSLLKQEIEQSLTNLGWQIEMIENVEDIRLSGLLSDSAATGLDAVLVVRYTPITYILPIQNYVERSGSGTSTADIGKIKKGRGLIPALELYDTKTGARLWYSAYHTETDADIKAVDKMISLTFDNADAPFPAASIPDKQSVKTVGRARLQHLF